VLACMDNSVWKCANVMVPNGLVLSLIDNKMRIMHWLQFQNICKLDLNNSFHIQLWIEKINPIFLHTKINPLPTLYILKISIIPSSMTKYAHENYIYTQNSWGRSGVRS